jgi:hypothetical protein
VTEETGPTCSEGSDEVARLVEWPRDALGKRSLFGGSEAGSMDVFPNGYSVAAGPGVVGGADLLPAHLLRWLGVRLCAYLAAGVICMGVGVGVLYVAHLVQPPGAWPNVPVSLDR